MSKVERTDAADPNFTRRVTYAGKTSVRADFDPKAFAQILIRSRKPKVTTSDREARLRRAEASLGWR